VATNGWREVWDHFKGRGAYPHQLAFLLLNPLRSLIFSPRELVARLHLTANSRVLELGPGPGFFSVHIARRIPSGHLCLVDLQREMLDKARARIRRAGVSNVSFAQASASALPFAREVFDAAFLVTVLGEVPDAAACVVQVARRTPPRRSLVDYRARGRSRRDDRRRYAALAKAANLEELETFTKRFGFTINFRKAG
jgi:uncharacterized protein